MVSRYTDRAGVRWVAWSTAAMLPAITGYLVRRAGSGTAVAVSPGQTLGNAALGISSLGSPGLDTRFEVQATNGKCPGRSPQEPPPVDLALHAAGTLRKREAGTLRTGAGARKSRKHASLHRARTRKFCQTGKR